jgi:RNA recognition motif-containing protein
MPDYQSNDGNNRRRRRRGGRPPQNRGDRSTFTRNSSGGKTSKPTGFQRFLSFISFGLLGKSGSTPKPKPSAASGSSAPRERDRDRDRERASSSGPRGEKRHSDAPRSAPTPGEVTTDRLYVGNLSYDAAESDLFELFSGVGNVRNAEVVVNSRTQRSKGFAFVTLASIDEARRAVAELHGKDFMGRPLQLSSAKPPPAGRGDRGDESSADEHEEAMT